MKLGETEVDYMRPDHFWSRLHHGSDGPSPSLVHVVTLNPEMVLLAKEDVDFRDAVNMAQFRVPDGAGLIWARWFLRSDFWSLWPSLFAFLFIEVERISGVEMVAELAKRSVKNPPAPLTGGGLYLLGGTKTQVKKTEERLRRKFPELRIKSSWDHVCDYAGPEDILQDIEEFRPEVLLVAYGAPRQTIWIERNRKRLENAAVRIAVGVGGAFAIISEERPRAPKWLRKLNLEWLWRLILEPTRLPRIWNAIVRFPLFIAQQKQALSTKN